MHTSFARRLSTVLAAASLLSFIAFPARAQPFVEQDGLLVVELETELTPGDGYPDDWRLMPANADGDHPAFPDASGDAYLQWDGGDRLGSPGDGTLAIPVAISMPGTYRFQWRSRIGYGANSTEHNDSWLKIDADAFYGEKSNGHVVCPKGYDPAENDCSGDVPNGSGSGGWFKAYLSGTTDWTWATRTSDNDGHNLFARFDTPGIYTIRVSGRSDGHLIDRLALYHSNVSSGDATDLGVPESPRGETSGSDYSIAGELRRWHPITVTFDGPSASEAGSPNPFLDYRFDLVVTAPSGASYVVPGYFAADGDAANTSATSGSKWRAAFTPSETGTHTFQASFRSGNDVAVSLNPDAGSPTAFDGAMGSFAVSETNKSGRDFRAKGFLRYVDGHYLQFDDGDYFIKGGADSPENFLGYFEFDNTQDNGGSANDLVDGVHRYEPHLGDWTSGDPTWQGDKGRGIIGAINYLASEGVNSQYFITMNVQGDGREVYPWTSYGERARYDVSKLAQWDIVFRHMTAQGVKLHVLTQETENDQLLNGGALGTERKLYYRELVARFGHHPALVWNLGEENTNTAAQREAFADYIRAVDPHDHPIVVHTYPGDHEEVFGPLLGFDNLEGPSLQLGGMNGGYGVTEEWVRRSAASGRPWVVTLDEPGNASVGCSPDGADNNHRACREEALWANLLAGGAGVEWYFGYSRPHNDLDLEDYRSRDALWDYTRHAVSFFHDHLPFIEMRTVPAGSVGADGDTYLFVQDATSGGWERAALYLANGTDALDLPGGTYDVRWFDPRNGDGLQVGSIATLSGGDARALGTPPSAPSQDWVVLLTRTDGSPDAPDLIVSTTELNFGTVESGGSAIASFAVSNGGGQPLTISAITLSGSSSAAYTLPNNPAPTTLAPGASVEVEVVFAPPDDGAYTATLTIASDDPDEATTALALVGAGGDVETQVVASFTLVDVGSDEDVEVLKDGASYTLDALPAEFSVRANTVPSEVGSVRFGFDGEANYQTENAAPYSVSGDTDGDYNPWPLDPGTYTLTATPYSEGDAAGVEGSALTVTFMILPFGTDGAEEAVPSASTLSPNAPNPFRTSTTVAYTLAEPGPVLIEVYDVRGVRVATLVDGPVAAGSHTATLDATALASGLYLCRMVAGESVHTQKLLLVR